MSIKKPTTREKRQKEYIKSSGNDSLLQRCKCCNKLGTKYNLDKHHPNRRIGDDIFNYMYLCRLCHDHIERNPSWSSENGFLNKNG